jgi:hypothetical protein
VAQIEIRFRMNMATGKKDIFIDFESDEDTMRHEHEKQHKKLIEKLIHQGVLAEDEVGEIIVTRQAPGQPVEEKREVPPEREAQGQAGG